MLSFKISIWIFGRLSEDCSEYASKISSCCSNDNEIVISVDDTEKPKIEIKKLTWCIPYINPSLQEQIRLNKMIWKNIELPIKFFSWKLVECHSVPETTRHT